MGHLQAGDEVRVHLKTRPRGTSAQGVLPAWVPDAGKFATVSTNEPADIDPDPTNVAVYTGAAGLAGVWTAWNGGVFAPTIGTYGALLMFGGGNQEYDGNGIVAYNVGSRAFSMLVNPVAHRTFTPPGELGVDTGNTYVDEGGGYIGSPYGADGEQTPAPIHIYGGCVFLPSDAGGGTQGSYVFLTHFQNRINIEDAAFWRFDIALGKWFKWTWTTGTNAGVNYTGLCYDDSRKVVWVLSPVTTVPNSTGLQRFFKADFQAETVTQVTIQGSGTFSSGAVGKSGYGLYMVMPEYCSAKDCIVVPISDASAGSLVYIDLNGYTSGTGPVDCLLMDTSGTACPSMWYSGGSSNDRLTYCSQDGALYALNMYGGTGDAELYKLTPPSGALSGTWAWSNESLTPQNSEALALRNSTSGTVNDKTLMGRMRFVPGLKSFVISDGRDLPAQLLRPSAFT